MPIHEVPNAKTTVARATGHTRSSRGCGSVGNCAALRLKASVCDSTRLYGGTQKAPQLEPQGIPEALEGMARWEIAPRFV